MLRSAERLWLSCLLAAWFFDFLVWGKPQPGISFFLFIFILLITLAINAWGERVRPAAASWALAGLALLLSFFTFLRSEPLTSFLAVVGSLGCFALLLISYRNGFWLYYRVADYVVNGMRLLVEVFIRPLISRPAPAEVTPPAKKGWWGQVQKTLPVVRGLLLALPVVLVLGALLASADLVFAAQVKDLLKLFDLKRLPEYIFRFCYIFIGGYILVGGLLHALIPHPPDAVEDRPDTHKPWMPAFLGSIEAFIVLGSVNLLFIVFLIIQFQYLFGGGQNINQAGFTYSEYARRGFFELVWVAVLSLGMYLVLGTITRRVNTTQQRWFSGLAIAILLQVGVILWSALNRMLLYESAYGFSRLRTYTHIFIFWLGALLAALIIFELIRQPGRAALAMLVMSLGFALTLGVMNVDGFIAQQNLQRARLGETLDGSHLTELSSDAVPVLVAGFFDPTLPAAAHDELGYVLACRTINQDTRELPWQSFHLGRTSAAALLHQLNGSWSEAYPVKKGKNNENVVVVNGKERSCGYRTMD